MMAGSVIVIAGMLVTRYRVTTSVRMLRTVRSLLLHGGEQYSVFTGCPQREEGKEPAAACSGIEHKEMSAILFWDFPVQLLNKPIQQILLLNSLMIASCSNLIQA